MDTQTKWLTALFSGLSMSIMATLVLWLLGDDKTFAQAALMGTIGGLIATPVMLWAMGRMAKNASKAVEEAIAASEDALENPSEEAVLRQTNATHFYKGEGVGGLLILTSKRLVFQSHGLNINKHRWEVALDDIETFNRRKTLGFIPNGLEVKEVNSSKAERFVVMGAGSWEQMLTEVMADKPQMP